MAAKMAAFFILVAIAAAIAWQLRPNPAALAPPTTESRDATESESYAFPATYEDHLKQLRSFQSSGGRIAYLDVGPADASKTLIMIHGVPTSSWMYRKIIDALAGKLRVIAVDLLGYGASDKPKDQLDLYEHAAQAAYVQELLSELNITDSALMVHDMGGLVGWELLRSNAPITDVVLLNTIISQQGFNHPNMNEGMMSEMVTKAYTTPMSSEVMLKNTFDELGLTSEFKLSAEECWGYLKPLQSGSDEALYAFFTSLDRPLFDRLDDNTELMASWGVRWRVFWGVQDDILTVNQLSVLKNHTDISDADITEFPENKHFLAEEVPEAVAAGVIDFLGLES